MSSILEKEVKETRDKELAELEAIETQEWLDSLEHVLKRGGPGRVNRLLRRLQIHAQEAGVKLPFTANTPYINTIPTEEQPRIELHRLAHPRGGGHGQRGLKVVSEDEAVIDGARAPRQ